MKPKFKMAKTTVDIASVELDILVDEFARIKAEIAELQKQEEIAKHRLIHEGAGTYHGKLHNIVLTEMPGRKTLDTKALCAFLKVSPNVEQQFTKVGNPFYQLKVTGR